MLASWRRRSRWCWRARCSTSSLSHPAANPHSPHTCSKHSSHIQPQFPSSFSGDFTNCDNMRHLRCVRSDWLAGAGGSGRLGKGAAVHPGEVFLVKLSHHPVLRQAVQGQRVKPGLHCRNAACNNSVCNNSVCNTSEGDGMVKFQSTRIMANSLLSELVCTLHCNYTLIHSKHCLP